MATHIAQNWETLVELEAVDFEGLYARAICQLASNVAFRQAEEQGKTLTGDDEPEISNAKEIFSEIRQGDLPLWWPKSMPRVTAFMTAYQKGSPIKLPSQRVSPDGRSCGLNTFMDGTMNALNFLGESFQGRIEIRFEESASRQLLTGWRGEVSVGVAGEEDDFKGSGMVSDREKWAWRQVKEIVGDMREMFQGSAAVLHASAAVTNAARGFNIPPYEQEEDDQPLWMQMLTNAVGIASAGDGGSPGQVAQQALSQKGPARRRPALIAQNDMAGPPRPDGRWSQGDVVQEEEGDFDGLNAYEDDLVEEEDLLDEDTDYEEEEYDDELEGDPVMEMSLQELQEKLAARIDKEKAAGNGAAVKQLGMGLVGKVL